MKPGRLQREQVAHRMGNIAVSRKKTVGPLFCYVQISAHKAGVVAQVAARQKWVTQKRGCLNLSLWVVEVACDWVRV